ncbi:hypothetical protein NDU88_007285 [Pleurodeles waltl]|uniref:Uncharacterized protein n=1 Tax=Pleurodeles waltl TaxID=8319 RepID=A0AAV7TZY6_PLEWA|nr:hypothetical protein NDU88_007285 [Pleurodeles waltl]
MGQRCLLRRCYLQLCLLRRCPVQRCLWRRCPVQRCLWQRGPFTVTQLLVVLSGPAGLVLAVLSGPAGLVLAVHHGPVGLVLAVLHGPAGLLLAVLHGPAGLVLAVLHGPAGLVLSVLSGPAGLVLVVLSWAAGLVLAVAFWAAGLVLAVASLAAGLAAGMMAVASWAAGMMAVASWAAGLVLAVASWAAGMMAVASWAAGMMAVFSAVLLFPDLLTFLWPFPTLEGVAADSTLPPVPLGVALLAGVFPLSRRALANFLCLTGGGLSVLWPRATLAALVAGALQIPVTTGTTGPGDVVAVVLGWDLESRALGGRRGGGGEGKRSRLDRKRFFLTLGRVAAGSLGVEEEFVVVGGVHLMTLGEGACAGGCREVDGCWVGVCLRLCILGGGVTDTLGKDTAEV